MVKREECRSTWPCANDNWHGHNFDLIVTLKGKPDPETGFVVDMNLYYENP